MQTIKNWLAIPAFLTLIATAGTANANVQLHSLFSNNTVLQREKPVPVWGTADAGEQVTVHVGNQTKSTVAATDGSWRVTLDAMPAATTISFSVTGSNTITLTNVAVGDVYVCSGQSNMEFGILGANNASAEMAAANYPNIRYLYIAKQIAGTPQKTFSIPTEWAVCSPQSIAGFSAVAYFFGRELNQQLNIPIGLINASVGATVAQAWTSRDSLVLRDDLRDETLMFEQGALDANAAGNATLAEQTTNWWNKYDTGTKNGWKNPAFNDAAWNSVQVPGMWEHNAIGNFDGVAWFRKQVTIPAAWAGRDVFIHIGGIDDRETTFLNGDIVGASDVYDQPHTYRISGNKISAGVATIAVRLYDLGGEAGFMGGDDIRLELADDTTQKIDISGNWKYQLSSAANTLPPAPQDLLNSPNRPTALYNGMISPLTSFAVRGAIWYQGEANTGNPTQYQTLFPELIKDWRAHWNATQNGSEFGFYYVQLANFMERVPDPVQSGWAELRDAQTGALQLPRTGMATTIDIGEAADIHPKNKQDVGKRLALAAQAIEYGQAIEYSGPMISRVEPIAGTQELKVVFTHAQNLRTTDGAAPRTFAIQDQAGNWFAATARIEGQTVIISNPLAINPKEVRYAWANNPDVNLTNGADLPTVPFRAPLSVTTNDPPVAPGALFNTGLDANGGLLAGGSNDPHWKIISTPSNSTYNTPAKVVNGGTWLSDAWAPNGSSYKWVGLIPNEEAFSDPGGQYTYETTFNLTGTPGNFALSGAYAVDDNLLSIKLNGNTVPGNTSGSYNSLTPFSITNGFQSGTNALQFVINNSGTSPSGLVVKFDSAPSPTPTPTPTNAPPAVALTSPTNGATVATGGAITLSANAEDSDGTVSKVEFFAGTTLLGTDITSPYTVVWTPTAAGSYSLTAKATDNQGAVTTSSAVTITVSNTTVITGLYNTGLGTNGSLLYDGSDDPHWTIVVTPSNANYNTAAKVVNGGTWLADTWTAGGSNYKWLGLIPNEEAFTDPSGQYVYQTTFNLSGNPSSFLLSGSYAVDDNLVAVKLNGNTVLANPSGSYDGLTNFAINSGFQSGVNTLQFVLNNGATSPSGLIVKFDSTP